MATRLRTRLTVIVLIGVLLLGVPSFVDFYVDWQWYGELGYQSVFLTGITAGTLLFGAGFAVAFLFLYGNLWFAVSRLTQPYLLLGVRGSEMPPIVLTGRQLRMVASVAATVVAGLLALVLANRWLDWLLFLRGTEFGRADPILGRDAGFYVFSLPWLDLIRGVMSTLVVIAAVGSMAVYWMAGLVSADPFRGVSVARPVRRHISLLAAGFLALLAAGAWLDMPRVLVSPGGAVFGATYVDVHATLPALAVRLGAALAGVALAVLHAFSDRRWPLVAAGALYLGVAVGGAGYAAILQRFVVAPNEQVKETEFIIHNIAATRAAFGVDKVEERELTGEGVLTRESITANADTIRNVRLWDHQPLLETFGQIQEIRTYYDFVSVDNDRYAIDGRPQQIMLSARELNSASLPNPSWINERLVFTHGYGLALGPVNEVTVEGLPRLFVKNIPPEAAPGLEVKEPSLYYGELSSDYVFVRTGAREFHYPKGEDNEYTSYRGTGGIPVGGLWGKLLLSIKLRSFKVLLSNDINADSRLMLRRALGERLRTIAPFLEYDSDPYLVLSEGRLFWLQDAYTVSRRYPYSTPIVEGINYIRNAVKIVVDAYHGTTTFYLADPGDPLATTYARVFPDLFRPLSAMPADLQRHLRYPEGIFALQAAVYSTYHMSNPAVFYNKEDQWEVPAIDGPTGEAARMQPYYTIMRLPGERSAEFIQMLPFTPRRKDNLAAWMVARSDGEHYGRLLVFQFPKQKVVFGPRQIVARINQDQAISPQITLWNQQGSQVIQGTLLVVPIEESLLYIRPLYLKAAGGRIPELKRVIVAYQNQIVMEPTLGLAIERLFGGAAPMVQAAAAATTEPAAPVEAGPPGVEFQKLAAEARQRYDAAIAAQRAGDWGRYGEEIRRLGEVLARLSRSKG